MSIEYFVDSSLIPNDGSINNYETFEKNTHAKICIYPDVHLKKGAQIVNGTLISSESEIFLSCLGVENCGFTFGKIESRDESKLIKSFKNYADILSSRLNLKKYSVEEIQKMYDKYLFKDYTNKKFLYDFLGYKDFDSLRNEAHIILDKRLLKIASRSICTLGGGNHFFEIHKVIETYDTGEFEKGDYIFMLHSDSIAVGDMIYELYSDLHELNKNNSLREIFWVYKYKLYQKMYFRRICKNISGLKRDLNLIFKPKNIFQSVNVRTPLGKNLMTAHNLSSIFGEMNRDAIVKNWSKSQEINIKKIGSHSHDNITAEKHDGKIEIIHRNGVQYIGSDKYCLLPSAMGNYSYIMKNSYNNIAYYSTNHGAGRVQDKHIAKDCYSEEETINEMNKRHIEIFRVGNGSLAEQNMHAFKEPSLIVEQMEKYNLATKAAKTCPIAVIKG